MKATEIFVIEGQSLSCPFPLNAVLDMPKHLTDLGITCINYLSNRADVDFLMPTIEQHIQDDLYCPLNYFHHPAVSIRGALEWWHKTYGQGLRLSQLQSVPMHHVQKRCTHQRKAGYVRRTKELVMFYKWNMTGQRNPSSDLFEMVVLDARFGYVAQAMGAGTEWTTEDRTKLRLDMLKDFCRMIRESTAKCVLGYLACDQIHIYWWLKTELLEWREKQIGHQKQKLSLRGQPGLQAEANCTENAQPISLRAE